MQNNSSIRSAESERIGRIEGEMKHKSVSLGDKVAGHIEETRQIAMGPSKPEAHALIATSQNPSPKKGNGVKCNHCHKKGHKRDGCWILHPHLRPTRKAEGEEEGAAIKSGSNLIELGESKHDQTQVQINELKECMDRVVALLSKGSSNPSSFLCTDNENNPEKTKPLEKSRGTFTDETYTKFMNKTDVPLFLVEVPLLKKPTRL
jgi:hypothetical protein